MNFTYTLTPGGYLVSNDGQPFYVNTCNPQLAYIDGIGQPFATEAEALAHLLAYFPEATPA